MDTGTTPGTLLATVGKCPKNLPNEFLISWTNRGQTET